MNITNEHPTQEERQANLDRLVSVWKERKQQIETQSIALLHSAEGKAALQFLKERNAAQRTGASAI